MYEGNSFDAGIDSGHGADLLGHINTLLGSLQLGDHLGGGGADLLGLQVALLLGSLNHHSLHLLLALDGTLRQSSVKVKVQLTYELFLVFAVYTHHQPPI